MNTVGDVAHAVDSAASALSDRLRTQPLANRAMYALSAAGDDGRIWFAAAAVEGIRRHSLRQTWSRSVGWLLLEAAVVNGPMKAAARRPRPVPRTGHEHHFRTPTGSSFPSGHAASAATMAVLLSAGSPLGPLWYLLAAGIGLSRVHVGVHHGSDVVGGFIVGAVFGVLARQLER